MTTPTQDRLLGVNGGLAFKVPCLLATTGNIVLSGEQNIDGTLTANSRVLVWQQNNAVENGIYDSDAGTWTRALDFDGPYDSVHGTLVRIASGATYGGKVFGLDTASPVIGTSALSFSLALFSGLTGTTFQQAGAGSVQRAAQDKMRERLSNSDFGTAAQAIAQAATFTQGSTTNLNPGITVLTATLTPAAGTKPSIIGDGRRHTILDWQGANNSTILKQAGVAQTADVEFRRMELKTTTGATGVTGIQVGEVAGGNITSMVDISDVICNGLATGIALYNECDETTITRSWIFDCTSGLTTSIGAASCSNINLIGNQFQGITQWCVTYAGGSRFMALGNTLQGTSNGLAGISLDKFDSALIANNYWESQAAAGTGPFVHLGLSAIAAGNMSGAVVEANHIDCGTATAGQIGVKVDFAKGVVVSANTFRAIALGIQLTANSSNCIVLPQAWGDTVSTKLTDAGTNNVLLDPAVGIRLPHLHIGGTVGVITEKLNVDGSGITTGSFHTNLSGDLKVSPGDDITWNAANGVVKVGKLTATGRSVDAAGTLNAGGTDYAEYETKAADCGAVAKGQIVGFDAEGMVTDKWANAISFGIKTTNPSFVGGDAHGSHDTICVADGKPLGEPPIKPVLPEQPTEKERADYDAALAVYKRDAPIFAARLEANRQTVDRIAYSGKVPVNVTGAAVGDYIIAVQDGDGIKGVAVAIPTFEQYRIAVGRVRRMLEDGRPEVAVIVH